MKAKVIDQSVNPDTNRPDGVNQFASVTSDDVREVMSSRKPMAEQRLRSVPPFPIHALPDNLANYVRELHQCNNFPIDYSATSLLFAASVAIGNSARVKVKEGYTAPAILWVALVGRPGTMKTHPLVTALDPLKQRDAKSFQTYKAERALWEQEKEQKTKRQNSDADERDPGRKPFWSPHLVTDSTMEMLMEKLEYAPRGLGLHRDELAGWWKSMDQYRAGGDLEAWLALWNGNSTSTHRKSSGDSLTTMPFVSVAGTTQPDKLNTLTRSNDGTLPRILFAYPDIQSKPYHSTRSMDPKWSTEWAHVIDHLLKIPLELTDGVPAPTMLGLSTGAYDSFREWDRMNTDRHNAEEDDHTTSIYPKLDSYVHRIALIVEMLHTACNGNNVSKEISKSSMDKAVEIIEYYAATARKVYFELFEAQAVDKLPPTKAALFAALPEQFDFAEGKKLAQRSGVSDSTYKRLIREPSLFKKSGKTYSKVC